MLYSLLFYFFSFLILFGAASSIFTISSMISLLWFIFTVFNVALMFMLMGMHFLAFMLIIIYVGAICVLFVFVVMMVNVNDEDQLTKITSLKFRNQLRNYSEVSKNINKYPQINKILLLIVFISLFLFFKKLMNHFSVENYLYSNTEFAIDKNLSYIKFIGNNLYTEFFLPFQLTALILFIAALGSILLMFKKKKRILKQNIFNQLNRSKENSIYMTKNNSKNGVENIKY